MSSVFLHGFIGAFAKFADAIPTISDLFDRIENVINGHLDDGNLIAGSLTSRVMADGIGRVASGSYVGDGTSADRIILVGFQPRYVHVSDATGGVDFFATGSGVGPFEAWHRVASGARTNDGVGSTDWQGIVSTGVELGHTPGGLSNINGRTFTWIALR